MRINHNISALKTNNILGKNNKALEKSLQRLSSGYRINCAADDAAGLAISQKMKTQIAGLNQAARNASDGISVIQTAEGALIEVEEMLQRMRELSVQAANGSNTDDDRKALQDEVDQLMNEINRISETTEFNTKKLLNGTVDRRSYSDNANVRLISLSDSVGVKSYSFEVEKEASQAVIKGQLTSTKAPVDGTITVNNQTVEIAKDDGLDAVLTKLTAVCDNMGIYVGYSDGTEDKQAEGGYRAVSPSELVLTSAYLIFATDDYGSDAELNINCSDPLLAGMLGISAKGAKAVGADAGVKLHTTGEPTGASAKVEGVAFDDAAGTGTITFESYSVDGGDRVTATFTVTAAAVRMEYTTSDKTEVSETAVLGRNTNRDVAEAIKELCSRPVMEGAFTVDYDTSENSITVVTKAAGADIRLQIADDTGLFTQTEAAGVQGVEFAPAEPYADGRTDFVLRDMQSGAQTTVTFTVTGDVVEMSYVSSQDGTLIRSQKNITPAPGGTKEEVAAAMQELLQTVPEAGLVLTKDTTADGKLVVSAESAVSGKGITIGVSDTLGLFGEPVSAKAGAIAVTEEVSEGELEIEISDSLTQETTTLTFRIRAGNLEMEYVKPDKSTTTTAASPAISVPITKRNLLTAMAALAQNAEDDVSFQTDAAAGSLELKTVKTGESVVMNVSDTFGLFGAAATAGNVNTSAAAGTGSVKFELKDAGGTLTGDSIEFEVTATEVVLKYKGKDPVTNQVREFERRQNISGNNSCGTVMQAMKDLCTGIPEFLVQTDLSDASDASITLLSADDTKSMKVTSSGALALSFGKSVNSYQGDKPKTKSGKSITYTEGADAGGFADTATVSIDGDRITVRDRDDFEMVFQVSSGSVGMATVTVLDAGPMTLQIGANEGQTMEVRIPKVDIVTLGIDTANIGTQEGASAAITLFENAIHEVSAIRAKLGAYQNRLDHAINSLEVSSENLTEALSRIEDTDMASEMATYTQLQVLTQAATSMLAQANERPQNILNLLQG